MRTLIFTTLLIWILAPITIGASGVNILCLYYPGGGLPEEFTTNTCRIFRLAAETYWGPSNVRFHTVPFSIDRIPWDQADVVYLAGFGSPEGYWADPEGEQIIPWCSLLGIIRARIIIIDSCYSGEAARCSFNTTLITATGLNSILVNMPTTSRFGNVSSLSATLYCMATRDCKEYPGCQTNDPQLCHLSLTMSALSQYGSRIYSTLSDAEVHPDIQIGVIHINGLPFREW